MKKINLSYLSDRKKIFYIFLGLVSVFLLILLIIEIRKPKLLDSVESPNIESIIPTDSNQFNSFEIKGNVETNIPERFKTYRVTTQDIGFGQLLNITQNLDKNLVRLSENHYQSSNSRLIYDSYDEFYLFSTDSGTELINWNEIDNYIETANKFVQNQLNISNATALKSHIQAYTNTQNHAEFADENNASYIEIPFTLIDQEIPSFVSNSTIYPVSVYINAQSKIVGFQIAKTLFSVVSVYEVNAKPLGDITNQFKNGDVLVLKTQVQEAGHLDFGKVKSLEIKETTFEYRVNLNENMLIPYHKIIANASQEGMNNPIYVEFLIPAVVEN